jgi:DNA-binding NtrC family response regulator
MLEQGRFRKDLFYRLNVIRLQIPPLRERREDVMVLSRHLLEALAQESNIPIPPIDVEARQAMVAYDWPGNVRELSNALERTLASMEGDVIGLDDLPFRIHQKRKEG